MICPRCGGKEFKLIDVVKGKQFKCMKCGYTASNMMGDFT